MRCLFVIISPHKRKAKNQKQEKVNINESSINQKSKRENYSKTSVLKGLRTWRLKKKNSTIWFSVYAIPLRPAFEKLQ